MILLLNTQKITLRLCLILLVSASSILSVRADVIKLKSGGKIEGIVRSETSEKLTIEIKFGEVKLNRNDVESIDKATDERNKALKEKWEEEKGALKTEVKQPSVPDTPKPQPVMPQKTQTQPKTPAQPAAQQVPQHKPGAITTVQCEDGKHSYAACLPAGYNEKNKYPVLFCFDPGGDGNGAVRRFAFAAEKYGWIVVGSLNAQNGPWEPILSAQSAMLRDIPKRYKTDDKKYYACGFSGGARMSYTIAYNNPAKFRGVIACGAGLGQGSVSKKVAVYSCVGEADSNINEVKKVRDDLQKKGVKTELKIFPGGHDWPPDAVIKQAVDWLAKN
ncbi:MAG: dienelactone hydrolase family protein [Candidatus Omnitrophica bacterium]|nr:dienelactone hydrolase family protein [Candidatus Omnitrophota bacterium]